jgi:hypothetical protein
MHAAAAFRRLSIQRIPRVIESKQKRTKQPMPKSRSRFFRLSLKSLFLLTAILAIWLAYVSNQARQQRAIVAHLNKLGARLEYDYQRKAQRAGKVATQPPGWPWLRKLIGDEYFQDVVAVRVSAENDDDLRAIGQLTQLEHLVLDRSNITDGGLRHLHNLRRLDFLSLRVPYLTSKGLVHLENLRQLRTLILEDCPNVDDAGVGHLRNLTELRYLNLQRTRVKGPGLVHFANLPHLTHLIIGWNSLDDNAIPILASFKALQELHLGVSKISDEKIYELHDTLPRCRIVWGDGSSPKELNGQ